MISTFLLCRFKSIFYAVDLSSFSFNLSNHLRANLIGIDELLAASGVVRRLNWLIIAHGRHSLISYPS
jgi:hypothetical protein